MPGFTTATVRFSPKALDAIQVTAEDYLVGLFADAQLCAIHANRITVQQKDINFARRMRFSDKEPQAALAMSARSTKQMMG